MSGKIEIPPTFLHPPPPTSRSRRNQVKFHSPEFSFESRRGILSDSIRGSLRNFRPETRRITRRYIHNRNYGEGEEGSLGNSWVFRRERGELGPRDNVVEVEDSRPFGPARYPRIVTLNWPADIAGLRVRFFSLPPSPLELLYQQATSGKNFLGPGRTILRASRLIVSNQLPLSEFQ